MQRAQGFDPLPFVAFLEKKAKKCLEISVTITAIFAVCMATATIEAAIVGALSGGFYTTLGAAILTSNISMGALGLGVAYGAFSGLLYGISTIARRCLAPAN